MDPKWLARNLATSWSRGAGFGDVARMMLLLYAGSLPSALRRPCWTLDLHYDPPIGALRLDLRDNFGSDRFICSEVLDHQCYRLPLAAPPATILDLGSNIGLAAIYFARAYPGAAIACVEPEPDNLALLRRNLATNGVTATIFAAAVHSEDGTVPMGRADRDYGHMVIGPSEAGESGEGFEADALSVTTILDRLGWERVGLAKMDIEGHERVVLAERCDWLHRVDALCLEYHGEGGAEQLGEVACRYGFRPPVPSPGGLWFLARP